MKPILLATDGSPHAAEATFEAIELARKLEAPLLAITVTNIVVPPYVYNGYGEAVQKLLEVEDERVSAVLAETKAAAGAAGLACETVRTSGPVVQEICELASARGARAIVVGAHGWGPIRRAVHGSVSQELVHDAPCAVLVVRRSDEPNHQGDTMKPILLATDGSPSAEDATLEAIELARAFDAPLLVVSVAHLVLPAYGGYYGYGEIAADLHKAETEHVDEVLAATKARVEAASVPCETIALDGPAVEAICSVARERDARLVVVGAHGWGRLGRMIHGSVSTGVLHDAPCPVLVVHGNAEPLAEATSARGAAAAH
jgi:Universal stress protein UspA and related nucleotide-binding proteins